MVLEGRSIRRDPRFIAFVLLVSLGVLAAAVVATGDEPAATTPPPERGPAPLRLATEPAWTSEGHMRSAGDVETRDGVGVVYSAESLALVDIGTGEARWTLEMFQQLVGGNGALWESSMADTTTAAGRPVLVAHDDGLAVLTEYTRSPCGAGPCARRERGLVLLSAEDGSVVWQVATSSAGTPAHRGLWAVDDRTALVALASPGLEDGAPRAVAYDVRDGTKRWELAGSWPLAIVGDTALTVTSTSVPNPRAGVGRLPAGVVGAVDLATGTPRWDLGEVYERSEFVLAAGDVALVRGATGGTDGARGALVTVADGLVLDDFGGGSLYGCATDRRELIACPRNGRLQTFQVADGQVASVRTEVEIIVVDAVWPDRIFVSDGQHHYSVDRAGSRIDEDLPGALTARTDDQVYFHLDEPGLGVVRSYRLRR